MYVRVRSWGYRFNSIGIEEKDVFSLDLKDGWLLLEKTSG